MKMKMKRKRKDWKCWFPLKETTSYAHTIEKIGQIYLIGSSLFSINSSCTFCDFSRQTEVKSIPGGQFSLNEAQSLAFIIDQQHVVKLVSLTNPQFPILSQFLLRGKIVNKIAANDQVIAARCNYGWECNLFSYSGQPLRSIYPGEWGDVFVDLHVTEDQILLQTDREEVLVFSLDGEPLTTSPQWLGRWIKVAKKHLYSWTEFQNRMKIKKYHIEKDFNSPSSAVIEIPPVTQMWTDVCLDENENLHFLYQDWSVWSYQ